MSLTVPGQVHQNLLATTADRMQEDGAQEESQGPLRHISKVPIEAIQDLLLTRYSFRHRQEGKNNNLQTPVQGKETLN